MGAEQSQLEELGVSQVKQNFITFMVNGKEYRVRTDNCDPDIGPRYLLVDYLRDKIGLTGTKYMCREGACGACIVTIKSTNPATGQLVIQSANSCLLPLYACDGLQITTIEGLGNRQVGYSKIIESLKNFGGTQCGFCGPGFVMHMNSLTESNPNFTTEDVEQNTDSNICRCTGYRPIIAAFKSLAKNAPEELKWKCADIEDTYKCPMKSMKNASEDKSENFQIVQIPRNLHLKNETGEDWFKVTALEDLYVLLERFSTQRVRYRLVAGNTGTGVFKQDGPYQAFIEINEIPELRQVSMDESSMVLGGSVNLSTAIEEFDKASKMRQYSYMKEMANHLRKTASTSVRNRATLAGNLTLKHMHRQFISDVFVLLESAGAMLTIGSSPTLTRQYTLLEFLDLNEWDLNGKVILSVHFPALGLNHYYKTFKLGKQHQLSPAYVNAGFRFEIDPNSFTILSRPRIVYGGINPNFTHANQTEVFLQGKQIDNVTVQGAMKMLENEVKPIEMPHEGSVQYRLQLTQAFLYRFFLEVRENSVDPRLRSGAYEIPRENFKGQQLYENDKTKFPLYEAVPKLESYPQLSGEAEYINDIKPETSEHFGVFVLSTVANAAIRSIDASKALSMPGVVAFITAKDIPGINNFAVFNQNQEVVFAEKRVQYAGQPVGLLVARDKYTAFGARSLVEIKYEDMVPPTIDIRDVVTADAATENVSYAMRCRGIDDHAARKIISSISERRPLSDSPEEKEERESVTGTLHKVKGEFYTHPQYHFHLETQICLCIPNEDGLIVYSSTQHMDGVQSAIAGVLNLPSHSITVEVRRLGGAFGAKISKASHVAAACALAAHVLNLPVRVAVDLETNMQMIGKRLPYLIKYEVEVDDTGKIHKLDSEIWCDVGYVANEPTSLYGLICFQSCYRGTGWNVMPKIATTDTAPNTYCRAPGSAQGIAAIEHIMEHIAYTVKRDPLEVRQINFMRKGDPFIGVPGARLPLDNLLPGMIAELKVNGDFEARRKYIDSFNDSNRWKKRGLSIVPQRYPNYYPDFRFPTFISVYHLDGTVNISHGAIEMGQGVNTKVAQVVAATLNIPLAKVKVKPSNNIFSPNTFITGASVGSELVCSSARRACEQLLERLEPIRKNLKNPTWEQLVQAANAQEILLTSQFQEKQGAVISYDVWGITMIEIEIDCLTGDFKIVRADMLEDCGDSLSPLIDIGQIEGAFIQGLSWWLTEELFYERDTGLLITDNTWHYKPMLPKDIPEDLRVTMLRNAPNPFGVLSSKATGEPPFNMAVCVLFALRNAIDSSRREVGNRDWYQMDGAVSREVIRRLCLTQPDQFIF